MTNVYQCQACFGTYADTNPDGSAYMHQCAPVFDAKAGVWVSAQNARNELLVLDRRGRPAGIVSAGAGVQAVTPNAPAQPGWITTMQAKVDA